ncbi:MAG: hypothetical protein ACO1SX_21340, partial [Actinomycetota bacterium]
MSRLTVNWFWLTAMGWEGERFAGRQTGIGGGDLDRLLGAGGSAGNSRLRRWRGDVPAAGARRG